MPNLNGFHRTAVGYTQTNSSHIAKQSKITLYDAASSSSDMNSKFTDKYMSLDHFFHLGAKASFTVNKGDVKNGNDIYLGSIVVVNNVGNEGMTGTVINGNTNVPLEFQGKEVGRLNVQQVNNHEYALTMHVTTNDNFSTDPTLSFSSPNLLSMNFQTPASSWRGAKVNDSYYTYFITPDNQVKLNMTYQNRKFLNDSDVMTDDNTTFPDLRTMNIRSARISKVLPFISAKNVSVSDMKNQDTDTWGGVYHLQGQNLPVEGGGVQVEQVINTVGANGKLSQNDQLTYWKNLSPDFVPGLNTTQIKQRLENTHNKAIISKQGDGSYLIGIKFNRQDLAIDPNDLTKLVQDNSYLYNVEAKTSEEKQQIINNTLDFYKQRNYDGFTTQFEWWYPNDTNKDSIFTFTDVDTGKMTHGVVGKNGSTFDGELYKFTPVRYIDDNSNQVIANDSLIGEQNKVSTYTIKLPSGYQLSPHQQQSNMYSWSSDNKSINYTFSPNQQTNDANPIIIRVKKAPKPVNAGMKSTRIIHYVGAGDKTPKDVSQDVTFTGTVDPDTNLPIHLTPSGKWDQVVTPTIKGFTPDIRVVSEEAPNPDTKKTVTVTYTANSEKAKLKVIDDTTGNELAKYAQNANGKFGDAISFRTNPNDVANQLKGSGYDIVSNSWTNGAKYDDGDNEFVIHVKHQIQNDAQKTTSTRKIHYTGAPNAPQDNVQTVNFNGQTTTDKATGQSKGPDWKADGKSTWDQVNTPEIKGYTPDIKVVQAKTPNADQNENVTVTYTANDENARLKVIDDHTGSELAGYSEDTKGKFGAGISFDKNPNDVAKELENKGYKVVSNSWQDGSKYQDGKNEFAIHVDHTTSAQSQTHVQNRTIHYVDGKGNKMSDDVVQKVNFTRTGTKDNVTGQIDWKDWTTNDKYPEVSSPIHDGYTPDKVKVDAVAPLYGQNQDQTVVYHRNGQGAEITYVDDTTGKVLKHEQAQGKYNDKIVFNSNVPDTIKGYENDGYVLVSNDFKDQNYSSDNTANKFTVHFKHGTKQVTRDKNVSQDINYQIKENGTTHSVNHYKAPDLKFTQSGIQDQVTKEINWNGTVADQQFKVVNTPTIKGYTPDIKQVPTTNIHVDSNNWNQDQNIKKTVTYTPDTETVKVIAKDRDTNKILSQSQLTGTYGSEYHATAPKITGYHLVKSPANASGKFGTNNADVVYLYAKDTPTDKGETTGTPSSDNTSVFQQNLTKQDTKDLPEMSEANMATATLAGLGLLALTGLVPVIKRKIRN